LFQNDFSDNEHVGKYSRAAVNLPDNTEIISRKFPQTEMKLRNERMNERTNKQTNKQTLLKTLNIVCYTTTLDKERSHLGD